MHFILIGFKHAGKTTYGKALAEEIFWPFIDTDHLIESSFGQPVQAIYQQKGAEYFRQLEKKIILSLNPAKNSIIATGGGAILDEENVFHLKKLGKLIYLDVPYEVLLERYEKNKPVYLKTLDDFGEIYQERKKLYERHADLVI